jgi:putative DNA primase/helicase
MVAVLKYESTSDAVVDALLDNGIKLASYENGFYRYEAGAWGFCEPLNNPLLDRIIYPITVDFDFPFAEKYKALWQTLKVKLESIPDGEMDKKQLLALPNGTLDPLTGTLSGHDPEDYTSRRISIEYDPSAKCPNWLAMLDRIFEDRDEDTREEIVEFLQRWFGLALIGFAQFNSRPLRKMLLLHGEAGTGKTTIAEVLKLFYHEENVCSASVDQISERFGAAGLSSARAWIADDAVGVGTKADAKLLKKIITGETLVSEKKFKDATQFRFNGPACITVNEVPEIKDETDALYGRTVLLVTNRVFTPREAKKHFGKYGNGWDFLKGIGEMPGVLNWALAGLAKVAEDRSLPPLAEAADAANEWRAKNDASFAFAKDYCEFSEGVWNFATPIGAAISVFAEMEHGTKRSPTGAGAAFGRCVGKVIPGVASDRTAYEKTQVRIYNNLKLTEAGQKWVDVASEKGLFPGKKKWPLNQKGL